MSDLETIISENQKDFSRDTFKIIMKNYGKGFATLPDKDKFEALKEILKLAGIELGGSPSEGLAIKIAETRRRDTDTQERIKYAQSWNLAAQIVSGLFNREVVDEGVAEDKLEKWQKYFYLKLNEDYQNE